MVDGNYERIVEKISESSGVDKEEVIRRVEAKRAKLSGLISQEGAAQIVAAELGVNFDNEKLKLNELLPGMRKVNTSGKVISLSPVRSFKTQKGDDGKVCNLILADDTSNIKVVLWDTNHIALIENGEVKEGSSVGISNASMRDNEIHLGSFSDFKPSSEVFDKVVTEKVVKEKNISEFRIGDSLSARAFIVQVFDPRFFEVNKATGKKLTEEDRANNVEVQRKALINIVLDDGTETMRAVLFHDNLPLIGLNDLDDPEKLSFQKEDLLGKEFLFSGNVRRNNFFNNEEFIIDAVKEVNVDELINSLESD